MDRPRNRTLRFPFELSSPACYSSALSVPFLQLARVLHLSQISRLPVATHLRFTFDIIFNLSYIFYFPACVSEEFGIAITIIRFIQIERAIRSRLTCAFVLQSFFAAKSTDHFTLHRRAVKRITGTGGWSVIGRLSIKKLDFLSRRVSALTVYVQRYNVYYIYRCSLYREIYKPCLTCEGPPQIPTRVGM